MPMPSTTRRHVDELGELLDDGHDARVNVVEDRATGALGAELRPIDPSQDVSNGVEQGSIAAKLPDVLTVGPRRVQPDEAFVVQAPQQRRVGEIDGIIKRSSLRTLAGQGQQPLDVGFHLPGGRCSPGGVRVQVGLRSIRRLRVGFHGPRADQVAHDAHREQDQRPADDEPEQHPGEASHPRTFERLLFLVLVASARRTPASRPALGLAVTFFDRP